MLGIILALICAQFLLRCKHARSILVVDITKKKPMFSKNMGLFDHITGDFFFMKIVKHF